MTAPGGPEDAPERLSVDEADVLAGDLIRALAPHAGDEAGVCAVLEHWLALLGDELPLVCAAAVVVTFADCLIPHPDRVPADGLTLQPPPPERTTNERRQPRTNA